VRLLLRAAGDQVESSAVTAEDGAFLLHARFAGDYWIEIVHTGYATPDSLPVRIEREEEVELAIRLSRSVMTLEPLTVVARRRDPRHDRTFEGALARRERFPSVGSRRVITRDDVEFRTAVDVRQVLETVPGEGGTCMIMYSNGNLVGDMDFVLEWLRTSSTSMEIVEYYRYYNEAPQGMRAVPPYIRDPSDCSVVALWSRVPEPDEGSSGLKWLLRFGAAAVAFLLFELLR
jgi:hypothetical protein